MSLHFLVFRGPYGISFKSGVLHDGNISRTCGLSIHIDGVKDLRTLNRIQIAALIGILRSAHDDPRAQEAVFYDGNWWVETHSGSMLGGCAKVIRRVRLAAA